MGKIEQEIEKFKLELVTADPIEDKRAIECQCIKSSEYFKIYEIADKISFDRPDVAYSLEQWANRHWCMQNKCFRKLSGIKK